MFRVATCLSLLLALGVWPQEHRAHDPLGDVEVNVEVQVLRGSSSPIKVRGVDLGAHWAAVLAEVNNGWNQLRLRVTGSRISIWVNGRPALVHAHLGRAAAPLPRTGAIDLSELDGTVRWRAMTVRAIDADEANRVLREQNAAGFTDIFDGRSFNGWAGPTDGYEIQDGALLCKPGAGGTIYWNTPLTDFQARLEFALPPGGNNGLAIRYPGEGDTAYVGMTELQVLDDNYEQVRGPIDPRQAHGSAYGMVAAARGYQRPIGEWNFQEVTVRGSTVRVELNGVVILDADLATVDPSTYMGGREHPGVTRREGFFGFAGHSDRVRFRNVQIRRLQ